MRFDADALIDAYRRGVFPMAEARDDPDLYLVDPPERGVLPLDGLHLPRRLQRTIRQDRFQVSADTDFAAVIDACAACGRGREDTWINNGIRGLCLELHARGLAHSIECRRDGVLVGGLYGVALGGAFFGESMFSRPELGGTDSSKVALAHLVARLRVGGFTLLDTQFLTDHLAGFGVVEIPRAKYRRQLAQALTRQGDFYALESAAAAAGAAGAAGATEGAAGAGAFGTVGFGASGDGVEADGVEAAVVVAAASGLGAATTTGAGRGAGGVTGAFVLQATTHRS